MRTHHLLPILLFSITISSVLLRHSAAELCHPDDKKALLQIKASLNNPPLLSSWQTHTDCCNWSSIYCDLTTHRIVSLYINNGHLSAGSTIPSAIGDLTYLVDLSLHKLTNLHGSIPASITNLHSLKYITFTYINLIGTIPSFLSQIRNLTYVNLSFNNLTGSIPSSLSLIPKLRYLGLNHNKLTGKIPSSLTLLGGNYLYLVLSRNQLSGEVPAAFRGIDFGYVDVSRNMLRGDGSVFFGANKTTQNIDISRNMFAFNMSKVKLQNSLTYLDLSYNRIYGSIPEAMASLDQLESFNVSYNALCGKIPVGGLLQTLGPYPYLHNRCLCGAPLGSCS